MPELGARSALLRVTDIPGVYMNRDGAQVNQDGVLLSIRETLGAERALRAQLDSIDETPAQYLRRVALDPRMPTPTRVQCAIAAAPYFDRRMPQALETTSRTTVRTETSSRTLAALNAMDADARRAALDVLEALGLLDTEDPAPASAPAPIAQRA